MFIIKYTSHDLGEATISYLFSNHLQNISLFRKSYALCFVIIQDTSHSIGEARVYIMFIIKYTSHDLGEATIYIWLLFKTHLIV